MWATLGRFKVHTEIELGRRPLSRSARIRSAFVNRTTSQKNRFTWNSTKMHRPVLQQIEVPDFTPVPNDLKLTRNHAKTHLEN
jgi:hypothetical protein